MAPFLAEEDLWLNSKAYLKSVWCLLVVGSYQSQSSFAARRFHNSWASFRELKLPPIVPRQALSGGESPAPHIPLGSPNFVWAYNFVFNTFANGLQWHVGNSYNSAPPDLAT